MLGKPFCALQHQKYLFERQANLLKKRVRNLRTLFCRPVFSASWPKVANLPFSLLGIDFVRETHTSNELVSRSFSMTKAKSQTPKGERK